MDSLSCFLSHSLSLSISTLPCFSPPLSSLSVCLPGLRSCCPPAPFLAARMTSSHSCLVLGVPIHHPDHHRRHQQHHLRMHTHLHKHIHLLSEDKRGESPHRFCGIASLKGKGRRTTERERGEEWRGEEGRSCWGRQKPLTCALPTIHLNKPQYRQI